MRERERERERERGREITTTKQRFKSGFTLKLYSWIFMGEGGVKDSAVRPPNNIRCVYSEMFNSSSARGD